MSLRWLFGAALTAVATGGGYAFAAPAPVGGIDGPARATAQATPLGAEQVVPLPTPAVRGDLTGCDAELLARLVASDPSVGQWIMVVVPTSSSTTGTLATATASGSQWQCTTASTPAMVGRQGTRPLILRRSGDDTTPAGIFPLGVVGTPQGPITFFGNSSNPGVVGPYRRIQHGDCYGANPNTPGYGHWRVDTTSCTGDDELLERNVQAYEHAVLIGANTEPDVSGDAPGEIPFASAIFLHRTTLDGGGAPKPTSGCVSIGHDALVTTIRRIDPASNPRFAIGTRVDLMTTPARDVLPHRAS